MGIFHIPENVKNKIIESKKWIIIVALSVVITFLWNIPEYSIFQKMEDFACCSIFLEYSGNIPYSRKAEHYHVDQFSGIFYFVKFYIPWSISFSLEPCLRGCKV